MYQPPPQPPQNKTKPVLIGCGALFVLLVACGAVVDQSQGNKSAAPSATVTATAKAKAAKTQAKRAAVKPHKAKSKCPADQGDMIVRQKVPHLPMDAQRLGSQGYLAGVCVTVEDFLNKTTPTGKGYCAAAAWAKDNPGYDAEQIPAKRLKNPFWVSGVGCA